MHAPAEYQIAHRYLHQQPMLACCQRCLIRRTEMRHLAKHSYSMYAQLEQQAIGGSITHNLTCFLLGEMLV